MFQRFSKNIIVVISVLNLIFLFGFNYRIPFIHHQAESGQEAEDMSAAESMESLESSVLENDGTDPVVADSAVADPAAAGETAPEAVAGEAAASQEQTAEESAAAEEPAQAGTAQKCVVSARSSANVRSGPGTEYDVVASLPNNTVLDITGEAQNGWYPVRAENGVEGYIIQTYVTMVGE